MNNHDQQEFIVPSSKPQDLDVLSLNQLISRVWDKSLSAIRKKSTSRKRIANLVYANDETVRSRTESIIVPDYFGAFDRIVDVILASVEYLELTSYLWDRGALKHLISGTYEQARRDFWNRMILWRFLRPLESALDQRMVQKLLQVEKVAQWPRSIEEDGIALIAQGLAEELAENQQGRRTIEALLLTPIRLPDDITQYQINDQITLKSLNLEERSKFLSTFDKWMPHDPAEWRNVPLRAFESLIEVKIVRPNFEEKPGQHVVEYQYEYEQAARILDNLKWALMIVGNLEVPEPLVVFLKRSRELATWMNRDNRVYYPFPADITMEQLDRTRDLVGQFGDCARQGSQLWDALRLFGRSYVAQLSRDRLLDAVFGLDTVLADQKDGSYGYKFALHGAALLATLPGEQRTGAQLYKLLVKLYDERSAAAHSGKPFTDSLLGEQAFKALMSILQAIVQLCINGRIDLSSKREVGTAVREYVLEQVAGDRQDTE